jgi:hypothetical protein
LFGAFTKLHHLCYIFFFTQLSFDSDNLFATVTWFVNYLDFCQGSTNFYVGCNDTVLTLSGRYAFHEESVETGLG